MVNKVLIEKAAGVLLVKSAVGHWRYQRLTAVVLTPLTLWLLVFLHKALNASYAETLGWISSPVNTLAIIAWTVLVFYHAALGVQVVLEDYVSNIELRHKAILATNLVFLIFGLVALLSIIFILLVR